MGTVVVVGALVVLGLVTPADAGPTSAAPGPPEVRDSLTPEPPPGDVAASAVGDAAPDEEPAAGRAIATERNGPLRIDLLSVERTPGGAVVLLEASNGGARSLSLSEVGATIELGEMRVASAPVLGGEGFAESLPPGESDVGALLFPRIGAGTGVLVVPWFATDPGVRAEPIEIELAVPGRGSGP